VSCFSLVSVKVVDTVAKDVTLVVEQVVEWLLTYDQLRRFTVNMIANAKVSNVGTAQRSK